MLGGVVCGTASYIEEVRQKMMLWGQAPDPFAAWLLERGLKTLDVRDPSAQRERDARSREWCAPAEGDRASTTLGCRRIPTTRSRKSMLDGFGGMMAIELVGRRARRREVPPEAQDHSATRRASAASIRSFPSRDSRRTRTSRPRRGLRPGIPDGFLRLSIGIESANDLIGDIEQALH